MKRGKIYFVEAVGANRIKIGFSTNLKNRMAQLRTDCGFPIKLIGFIYGTMDDETQLLFYFYGKEMLLQGEWYDARIYEEVAQLCKEHGHFFPNENEVEVKRNRENERMEVCRRAVLKLEQRFNEYRYKNVASDSSN